MTLTKFLHEELQKPFRKHGAGETEKAGEVAQELEWNTVQNNKVW